MPYIPKDKSRDELDVMIANLSDEIKRQVVIKKNLNTVTDIDMRNLDGTANYCISRFLVELFELETDPKYTKFNTVLGVLECIKNELYRRLVAKYEDEKIKSNGDVFKEPGWRRKLIEKIGKKSNIKKRPTKPPALGKNDTYQTMWGKPLEHRKLD